MLFCKSLEHRAALQHLIILHANALKVRDTKEQRRCIVIHGCRHINELPKRLEAVMGEVYDQRKERILKELGLGFIYALSVYLQHLQWSGRFPSPVLFANLFTIMRY